jgi:phosphopantothenoylcysteine decarboxylase/phosphopantothenate--cysteine ligase
MGYALAAAAVARGWRVDLVSGPVGIAPPANVELVKVVSAEEMMGACRERFAACDLFIAVAAVADYRPRHRTGDKQKKTDGPVTLELEPTVDILATLAATKRPGQVVVGFAAETADVEIYARAKLARKNCDWMVANDVGARGIGMEADDNAVCLIGRTGDSERFGPAPKRAVAEFILDRVLG